jgi:hypothetical protein
MIIGAVIIKHRRCLFDEETAQQIQDTPYLQFFAGTLPLSTRTAIRFAVHRS